MPNLNLGDHLNRVVGAARSILFNQSELAQLTYGAFDIAHRQVEGSSDETVSITFPIGLTADNKPINHTREYSKQELLERYQFLGLNQLAINQTIQLVTLIEAMWNDLLRAVIAKYPEKLGSDKKISLGVVLGSSSIEVIHAHAIDTMLNELAYKSPKDYGEAVERLTGINIMECAAFHKYIEVKATRDVYIHSRGFANEIYERKAGLQARVKAGNLLPLDLQYFFSSFEQCMQLIEWLEVKLHEKWYSSEFEARRTKQNADDTQQSDIDSVSDQLKLLAAKYAKPSSPEGGAS